MKEDGQPAKLSAPFNAEEWTNKLLKLNAWARPYYDPQNLIFVEKTPAFEQARLQASLKRWKTPVERENGKYVWHTNKDDWNAWARAMVALKQSLVETALWSDHSNSNKHPVEQQTYNALAAIDFSGLGFPGIADFEEFVSLERAISRNSSRQRCPTSPPKTAYLYFVTHTKWNLQSHTVWLPSR